MICRTRSDPRFLSPWGEGGGGESIIGRDSTLQRLESKHQSPGPTWGKELSNDGVVRTGLDHNVPSTLIEFGRGLTLFASSQRLETWLLFLS